MADVHTDRNVPPLPAHITFEQAKGVAESILHGDPEARRVVANSASAVRLPTLRPCGRRSQTRP